MIIIIYDNIWLCQHVNKCKNSDGGEIVTEIQILKSVINLVTDLITNSVTDLTVISVIYSVIVIHK